MVESGVTEGGKTQPIFFFVKEHNNTNKQQQFSKVIPEGKQQLVEEKDADNIRKVLFKSFIKWFSELNLCSYKTLISTESTVLIRSASAYFFCCCWRTLKWKSRNIRKHLMSSGPLGNQLVLFSLESWCFPRQSQGKHQDSGENKTNCFPQDLTLNVYYLTGAMECPPQHFKSKESFIDFSRKTEELFLN